MNFKILFKIQSNSVSHFQGVRSIIIFCVGRFSDFAQRRFAQSGSDVCFVIKLENI